MKVSIGIIAFNEEKNLPALLEGIREQDYAHSEIEIILVDGLSVDSTKEIMENFSKEENDFWKIKVLDNPKVIQAAGWNVVMGNSEGDVIIRLDAHSLIPKDFVSQNVECIKSGEYVCGGKRTNVTNGTGKISKILLLAEKSMFGSGIAPYRRNEDKAYVKTVAHACYRKEVFEKVGFFNEKLLRSEDNEMHYRIRKAGYQICFSPSIESEYQTRATFKAMMKQKFQNGLWVGMTSQLGIGIFSLYHYIPFLFVIAATICAVAFGLAFLFDLLYLTLPFLIGIGIYFVIDIALTSAAVRASKNFSALPILPFIFPMLHFAYGFGTLFGFIKLPFVNLHVDKGDDNGKN